MRVIQKMEAETFKAHFQQWNYGLEPLHVAPLQTGITEDDRGSLAIVLRTKAEANAIIDEGLVIDGRITSVPVSRKIYRVGKYEKYFDFKWLKFCAHVNIYYIAV